MAGLCVCGCLILSRGQGRLIGKVTFEQRPERSKGVSHVEIWEGIPGRGHSQCKALVVCLVWLRAMGRLGRLE